MQTFSQSPTEPAFVQNPYPFYDRMRLTGDFAFWNDYDMPCAVSHAAVSAVLRDKRMGRAPLDAPVPDPARAAFDAIESHSMLELEAPDHTRLRRLVLRAFTSRQIAALEDGIRALCHDLIDRFPTGDFDLLTAYAQPVPVITIARLLGVPEQAADNLLRWSNAMVAMYQARLTPQIIANADHATRAFTAFLQHQIAEKRNRPGTDLLSTLIAARDGDARLSEPELISTVILLLNAGHEATVHTLGNGVRAMLDTGLRRSDPAAVEEIMRYDPPLHMFTRWVYEPCTVLGQDFARGDRIACLLGAANRDPGIWSDPNTFIPDRDGPAHVAFGGGIHFCVGAPLARLELCIALEVLWERCPQLVPASAPSYADVYHFHGLDRLMVRDASGGSI
ncbi:cytochrome P450 [Loktanella sp. SALINAS62]|uniref:cytochrome P450 n=1 Tax=Loktanella sp. SALINAS62 TaxID=2706124 RepID=UPI001B8BA886|nr:cytochrome P450 [Loktanella sp. SALINAS62]MBS1301583.1 cytochrome P450 [Loktanella sp. SALINAS62]